MNTKDRTDRAFSDIWGQEAQRKAKEQQRIKEKDAEAEKVLKEIKDLFPKKKQQQTIISTRTPFDYDYNWSKRKKENE